MAGRDSGHLLVHLDPDPAGPLWWGAGEIHPAVWRQERGQRSPALRPLGRPLPTSGAVSLPWVGLSLRSPSSDPLGFCEEWDQEN